MVILGLHGDLTAITAVLANRIGAFEHPWPIFIHGQTAGDRTYRTDLHTTPAKLAVERVGSESFDFRHCAAAGGGQGFHVHHLVAVANAAETLHATVHLRFDERAEILLL